MTRVVGVGLLASAFAPLVLVLALIKLPDYGAMSWVMIAASLAAFGLMTAVLKAVSGLQTRTIETKTVKRADERVLAFTSTYVVPVVVAIFAGTGVAAMTATAALLVVLVVIYVQAGLYHLNPTLAVLGFRVYEVTAASGAITMLLTRTRHIPQVGVVHCQYVGDDVAIQLRTTR